MLRILKQCNLPGAADLPSAEVFGQAGQARSMLPAPPTRGRQAARAPFSRPTGGDAANQFVALIRMGA